MAWNAVLHFEMAHFERLADFFGNIKFNVFENQPNEICRYLSEKASKSRFPTPEKLQNHSNKSKEFKRKGDKERPRRKSGGEKKKQWLHSSFL